MRKATSDYAIIVIDDKFVGFALGYDYCAEHEWGIKGIKEMCGMPVGSNKNMGIICRTITKCPPLIFKEEVSVQKKKNTHGAILFTGRNYRTQEENEKYVPRDLEKYMDDIKWNIDWDKEHPSEYREPKDPILTAWSEDGFGIGVVGDTEVGYLKELNEAFKNKNVTIAMTNLGAFAGSSLCLLITDRVPAETAQQMYDADKEYYDREEYEEKIGMAKLVEKHRRTEHQKLHYFMACSPKWINYEDAEAREKYKKEHNTKYDIIYWINYSDDDENHGYYTVEEIREWLTGTKKLTEIRKGK
jgi:hypothetical protein